MPVIGFGEKLPSKNSQFIRLKNTNDRLQFRIIGAAMVDGKHWFKNGEDWDIQPCPRINNQSTCEHCDKLDAAIRAIPRIEDKEEYRKEVSKVKNSMRPYVVAITYNFPVINRDTHEYAVYAATPGIRSKIEAEFALGVKVMDVDFVAMNTGGVGKEKYALTRVDSSDTMALTEKELEIKNGFNLYDFVTSFTGTLDDESGVSQEANSEIRDEEPNV